MKLSFLASRCGIAWTAAGIVLVELTASIALSTASPANASSVESSDRAGSLELAETPSNRLIALDEQKVEQDGLIAADDDDGDDDGQAAGDDDDGDDDGQAADDDNDDDGEQADIESLPEPVAAAILKDASQQSGMQASQLRIVKVERQTWSDGCLGLGDAGTACTQARVPGWRVIVANSDRNWVYRCDASGSVVKLDAEATRTVSRESTLTTSSGRRITTTRTTQTSRTVTGNSSSETERQVTAVRRSTVAKFADISQDYWARDFIAELSQRGILTGFPDGRFRPNEPITRAQFAAIVASVFEMPEVRNAIGFRDISTRHWAYSRIRKAYEMGFLEAISGNQFNPNQSLTRLQIVTALAKGLNYNVSGSTTDILRLYSDAAAIPASARNLVAAATEQGIIVNYPNVKTCSPNKIATRAEVAAMIYQAMVSKGKAVAISSPYVVRTAELPTRPAPASPAVDMEQPAPPASPAVDMEQPAPPASPAVETEQPAPPASPAVEAEESDRNKPERQNCNQGIGNGAEGCDPGNSSPRGGSNDEGGRTPGNRPK